MVINVRFIEVALGEYVIIWYNIFIDYLFSEPKLLETVKNHLATILKKIGVVSMLSGLLTNGTVSVEYSVGDFTIGYEHQVELEQEQQVEQDVHEKVAELSRKANNHLDCI